MKIRNFFSVGLIGLLLVGTLFFVSCKTDPTCDDENNCSAANNAYYCGKSGCAADYGNRCGCD